MSLLPIREVNAQGEEEFKCGYCPVIPYVGEDRYSTQMKLDQDGYAWDTASVDASTRNEVFNKPLMVTDDFIVVPTIGSFVPGYLLVIPREHIYSLGELGETRLVHLEEFLDRYVSALEFEFGPRYLVFEHGSGGPDRPGGSCVRHAHLHLIPVGEEALIELEGLLPFTELDSYQELTDFASHNYAFIDSGDKKLVWQEPENVDQSGRLPGQWIRREVTRILALETDWDWLTDQGFNNARVTRRVLSASKKITSEFGRGDSV